MTEGNQVDRIERLHDWFALQLRFAHALAARNEMPLEKAITFYTNLHRRFGFGRPSAIDELSEWAGFVRALAALRPGTECIAFTKAFARGRLTAWSGKAAREFGCFSFDAPKEGVVRIHFAPRDLEGGVGPLRHTKYRRRTEELATMFAFIQREHPIDAREVVGGSWLYSLAAYRRLFAPAYIERLRIHTSPSQLTGGSWWGQFIDRDENVIVQRVKVFESRLASLELAEAWKMFPMPAMTTRASIGVFYAHYEGCG